MYIPEFACGVIATILAEIGTVLIVAAYDAWKYRKKDGDDEED